MLSRITGEQLKLVAGIAQPVIALLGVASGNGLDNVHPGQYKTIVGMDINEEFLELCRQHYAYLPELELHCINLMAEKERAVNLLQYADLVIANMIVEHIHLDNFLDIAGKLTRPVVSVTIQSNPDGQMVSHSGFEASFARIQCHAENCEEASFTSSMRGAGYRLMDRAEYKLPNGKIFIRLDYQRSC